MRRLAVVLLLVAGLFSATANVQTAAAEVRIADERVLLRTNRGDLVIALFPDVAPMHVTQLIKLVRLGVYDSAWFHRIEPGFVIQLTDARNRKRPLSPEQIAELRNLPGEFSDIPHSRGVVSMARQDGDVDSAESSFSILLGPAPHLDGRYTIFGRLEWGDDVLSAIAASPRDPQNKPVQDIIVESAEVKGAAEIQRMRGAGELRGPVAAAHPSVEPRPASRWIVVAGISIMMALNLLGFFAVGRLPPHRASAFHILAVLVGSFLLLRELVPVGRKHNLVAVALFLGTIALFKLMNRFENLPQKDSSPKLAK